MKTRQALKALSALSQESRLAVFKLLVRQGKEGMAAGEIGERLAIPAATLSFHLSQLSNADLVKATKQGRTVIYAPDFESMQGLIAYLLERFSEENVKDGNNGKTDKKKKKKKNKDKQPEEGYPEEDSALEAEKEVIADMV